MSDEVKSYMVLDAIGNPIAREGDEANPHIWCSVMDACEFAKKELPNQDAVSVVEIVELERRGSGK